MSAIANLRGSFQAGIIPPHISYREEESSTEQRTTGCWKLIQPLLEKLGEKLRNAFYLPLYHQIDSDVELNQHLAERATQALQNTEPPDSKQLEQIRDYFSVRDIPVQLEGPKHRVFTIRLFESKMPIRGKTLRMILFSFYGHSEGYERTRWNPQTVKALREGPLSVMRALKANNIQVDSLLTTSLGNVALDRLDDLSQTEEFDIIPQTLIINRGLTSVKKVLSQLYPFPLNYLFYWMAKLCGWDANPEEGLLAFLEREAETSHRHQRKVIMIEALRDFYFSGQGQFESNMHEKLTQLGVRVFRGIFYPFPFHLRSHHALSLNRLTNNRLTQIPSNTIPLALSSDEKMSSILAKNVFLSGNQPSHTCFYICGNEATLDIGTSREAVPLLSAFIKEGRKLTEDDLNAS